MIIKKKRLNNIRGLGKIPADSYGMNLQDEFAADENGELMSDNTDSTLAGSDLHSAAGDENQIVQAHTNTLGDDTSAIPESIDLFNLDNIDFSQRQERRKGERRRGFRRVDDRNLVSRAREEADAIRESAVKEGYQSGLEQSQADITEFKNSLEQFIKAKEEVFGYIAPDILEISVDIAQKIIKKEVEQDPQILFNTIVDVLKTLSKEETKVTLRINPAEINEVKQSVPELLNLAGIDTKIVVLSDEEVSEGGCLVTTTNGIVDATIESRIALITRALKEL